MSPSANAFAFGDFNIHHKDWLTYSEGTDRSGEIFYDFPVSNDLTQMVKTFLLGSQTVIVIVLLCWISFFLLTLVFCSTMAFPPFGNSDHVAVSVSIGFPTNSQRDAPFHCIAYHLEKCGLFSDFKYGFRSF